MLKEPAIILLGKNCTGCEACVQACPYKALDMRMDEEGFYYPFADADKCTKCGVCSLKCPVLSYDLIPKKPLPSKALAGSIKNKSVALCSASGGAFSAIANVCAPDVVYGMAWTENNRLECKRTVLSKISVLRNSKYIQARIKDSYINVKEDLKSGKKILFSGTPCQIAGLLKYLGNHPSNLITAEIICHGVASPGLYEKYCDMEEKKNGSAIKRITFRKKSAVRGNWEDFYTLIEFENGKVKGSYHNVFTFLFLSRVILRPSCAGCPFASGNRVSDLVLGDYWGCLQEDPHLYRKTGVSVIFPMTETGESIVGQLEKVMDVSFVPSEHIIRHNKALIHSQKAGEARESFFTMLKTLDIDTVFNRVKPGIHFRQKIKPYLRWILKF